MHSAEPMRAKTFNIRFSEEELQRLDLVANHFALTAAGVIRMLVKREADRIERETLAPGFNQLQENVDRALEGPVQRVKRREQEERNLKELLSAPAQPKPKPKARK